MIGCSFSFNCSTALSSILLTSAEFGIALIFADEGISGTKYRPSGFTKETQLSGQWKSVNESMSEFSRSYQKQITGRDGQVWLQNNVKFDGMKDGILIETKGKYSQFIDKKTGEFYSWFSGKKGLIEQAKRQLKASEGARIQWYFAEKDTLNAVKALFMDNNIKGIELIYEPYK